MAYVDRSLTWLGVPSEDELPPEVRELWQAPLEKLGFVPNVLRLYALRPAHLVAWNAHYEELMKGASGLTKAEREMIAVVVSVRNRCAYCIAAHSAALRKLTKDPALADALRAAGWTDEDVMDIAEVTGMFNFSNRLASGLGWAPNPEYDSLGR